MSDTILTDKTLKSKNQEDDDENENGNGNENVNENYNVNENVNENENENGNENGKTLMSSERNDDDETMSENEIITEANDILGEIIDKSKSSEEQIKSLEKVENLGQYLSTILMTKS